MNKKIEAQIIGKTLQQAKEIYSNIRVSKVDGKNLALTMDYKPTRANVLVENEKIVSIINWG